MYQLTVLTKEKILYQDKAEAVVAPGKAGYFEILKDHAPFISLLKEGKLVIKDKHHHRQNFSILGGVLEVSKNICTVIVET